MKNINFYVTFKVQVTVCDIEVIWTKKTGQNTEVTISLLREKEREFKSDI